MASKKPADPPKLEDLVVEAASAREAAALDVYDSLTSYSGHVGTTELIAALIEVGEVATATSLKQQVANNRSPTPLMTSPRRQNMKEQQVADFLRAHGTSSLPRGGFGGFVELYNEYVEYGLRLRKARSTGELSAHGGDRLSPRDLRGGDHAEARIINMATSSIAARLSDSPGSKRPTPRGDDRSSAPAGQRSGNLSARGGLSSLGGMTVMQSSDDAPSLPEGVLDGIRMKESPRVRHHDFEARHSSF